MVVPRSTAGSGDVQRQLAKYYGSAFRHPAHLAHFRLVTERGQGYRLKLFEIVAGALITARAQPGAELVATLGLVLPEGVTIRYRAVGVAGEDGVVQLRVPYATGRGGGLRTLGPYRITLEGRRYGLPVTEADVLEGRTVPLMADH